MPDRDGHHDLALLTEAALASGKIALQFWRRDPKVWEKPGQGPVTEADMAVNAMLARNLAETLIKPLYRKMHALLRAHQQQPLMVPGGSSWVPPLLRRIRASTRAVSSTGEKGLVT